MGPIIAKGLIVLTLILISLIFIFFKKTRKLGIWSFISILTIVIISMIYQYYPRHYSKNYKKEISELSKLSFRSYADSLDFYIGSIASYKELKNSISYKNFNSFTPENELKLGFVLNNLKIGQYNFSKADSLIDIALRNGMRIRGHTLVWGKLSHAYKFPDLDLYLKKIPLSNRKDSLWKLLETHIATVLKHYHGKIFVWDVVNEPMSFFRDGKLENNVYYKYLGPEYIENSFRLAHSIDTTLKLYLNENFFSYTTKTAEVFIELLKDLKKKNVPIDGVGIQAHVADADTSIGDLINFMNRITSLGFEVEITELDARLRMFSGSKDPYEAQGKYYGRLLKACMENPMCKGVTFWGLTDRKCWYNDMPYAFPQPNEPYLFDAELNPKPAFKYIYQALKSEFESKQSVRLSF